MKIVWMNGGLGNQAFQYIFLRYLETRTDDACYIDDRFFFQQSDHNGYELDKIFGVKPKKLSELFDADDWNYMVNTTTQDVTIVDFLQEAGLNIDLISEGTAYVDRYKNFKNPYKKNYYGFTMNSFAPEIVNVTGNYYYHGYYINAQWFAAIMDVIVKEFTFPEISDDLNKTTLKEIQSSESVCLHVRRGDFIRLGWVLDSTWYQNAVTQIKRYVDKPVFFIFSDDAAWCRENRTKLGFTPKDNIVFVEHNKAANNFRDMQLMSQCKIMIIANSSFSYLAALLNRNPKKIVLNPTSREIV